MQVFLPYNTIAETAACLFKDKRRYNKQIIECGQIIAAIKGESNAWSNHPIVWQYRDYVDFLAYYKSFLEQYKACSDSPHWIKNCILHQRYPIDESFKYTPYLFDQDYLDSHKRRLYQKNPEAFPEFAEYDNGDTSNLYCVPLDFPVPKRKGVSIINECENYKVVKYS